MRFSARWVRWGAVAVAIVCVVAVIVAHVVAPPLIDRGQNRIVGVTPAAVSAEATALHRSLTIADMHADSLIWGRPLLERNSRGQVDLPRLQDANVAVQVFAVATKVPRARSPQGTSPDSMNLITISALVQWWPPSTWWSLTARAEYLARVLDEAAAGSASQLIVARTREDLEGITMRRSEAPRPTAAVLAIEGLHALDGRLENVRRLWNAGYRMMSLVHQFDNDLGGSSSGIHRGGLTPFGRDVLRELARMGVIVDLAHASPSLIREVTSGVGSPVVVSHTGVQGTCNRPRNLSDDEVRAIAETGGLVGIGFWAGAVCGSDASDIARAIRYTADLVGTEHVALGSDFDGDRMPFDARGLRAITAALMAAGFTEDQIRLVMGDNLLRLLRERLPQRERPEATQRK